MGSVHCSHNIRERHVYARGAVLHQSQAIPIRTQIYHFTINQPIFGPLLQLIGLRSPTTSSPPRCKEQEEKEEGDEGEEDSGI